jgi:hypothetical protein
LDGDTYFWLSACAVRVERIGTPLGRGKNSTSLIVTDNTKQARLFGISTSGLRIPRI